MAVLACLACAAPASAARPQPAIRGTLALVPGESSGARDRYAIETPKRLVWLADGQPATLVGRRVAIRDTSPRRGVQGRVRAIGPARRAAVGSENARPRTVAVVRFAWTASDADPAPPATVRTELQTAPDSTDALLRAQTDGAMRLRGLEADAVDVYPQGGPAVVTKPSCGNMVSSLKTSADAAIAAATTSSGAPIAPSSYDHIMIVFPESDCFGWSGLAMVGGTTSWFNGSRNFAVTSVTAHELGHNLGALHASTMRCLDGAGAPVMISGNCTVTSEYGDWLDTMGNNGTAPLMSSYNRAKIGALPSSSLTYAQSGAHQLTDANAPGTAGTRLLMIPRLIAGQLQGYFALEFRTPRAPFDTWRTTDPPAQGLTIRLVPSLTNRSTNTRLVDTTPLSNGYANAPLLSSATFSDPESGVTLVSTARAGATATVEINGSSAARDFTAPVFPAGAALTARFDQSAELVGLSWPDASDDVGVAAYEVWRDGARVWTGTARAANVALPAPGTQSLYAVHALDAAGNRATLGPVVIDRPAATPLPGDGAVVSVPVAVPPITPIGASPGAVPGALDRPQAATTIGLTRPALRRGRATLPRDRRLTLVAAGAARMVVSINGRRRVATKASVVMLRLTAAQRRSATVTVRASGGTLARSLRLTLRVRSGRVTRR